ncbi:MAG TPA: hypothetical protein VNU26_18515 [Mycobacteriales bacterium]|nr:hypothetical protein [Mycobacteriales bacterium]
MDDRIAAVAQQMGVTEQTALGYLPADWAKRQARETAVEWGGATLPEATAEGLTEADAQTVAEIGRGLAVVLHDSLARTVGELPVSTGEPLDALSDLLDALTTAPGEVLVERRALLTAARYLGDLSDRLHATSTSSESGPEVRLSDEQRQHIAERLGAAADWARRAAQ